MSDEPTHIEDGTSPADLDGQADGNPAGEVIPFRRLRVGARAMALAGFALATFEELGTPTHTAGGFGWG